MKLLRRSLLTRLVIISVARGSLSFRLRCLLDTVASWDFVGVIKFHNGLFQGVLLHLPEEREENIVDVLEMFVTQ